MSGYPGQLDDARARLATMLFALGAIRFSAEGFTLKLHEADPTAPKSPYYFDLRMADNPKPGEHSLTQEAVNAGAHLMFSLLFRQSIIYDHVVGLPNAGDPFAKAIENGTGRPRIELQKIEEGGKRRIVPGADTPAKLSEETLLLLVDDLISRADSKFEGRDAFNGRGGRVTDIVVLVDREQGGREALAKEGITLHAVFTATELFDFYVEHGHIDGEMYDRAMAYLASEKARAAA